MLDGDAGFATAGPRAARAAIEARRRITHDFEQGHRRPGHGHRNLHRRHHPTQRRTRFLRAALHHHRPPGRRQRPRRPPDREADPLQPRAHPGARRPRQGRRRIRRADRHRGRLQVHQGRPVPARHRHPDAGALLHRRRRAGFARRLARRARFLAEVLHRRGQLRPRRQQHPGVLHPRRHQVPRLHPLAEAPPRHRPARRQHAVGLLDLLAGVRPPGHLPHGRPRHPEDLAQHGRLRLAHLPVDQRSRRALLGEVPLQDPPGLGLLHRRRGRRARRPGHRPLAQGPVRGHRARRLPHVGRQGADHAVRRGRGLPLEPVRPDQDLVAEGLPAHPGRPLHAEREPAQLLRPDRAGRVRAVEPGRGHRLLARQDAAGPRVLLRRRPPLPPGRQLGPDPRQPPGQPGEQLLAGRRGHPPLRRPEAARPRLQRRRPRLPGVRRPR